MRVLPVTAITVLLAAATAIIVPAPVEAQLISDDFSSDTLSDYTNPSGGRDSYTYNATDEWVDNSLANSESAMANNTTIGSFDDHGTITLSIDFLTVPSFVNSNNNNTAGIGVSTVAADFFSNFVGIEATVRTLDTEENEVHFLRIRGEGDSARHGELVGSNFDLTVDTWYTLSLAITHTSGFDYSVDATVFDRTTSAEVGSLDGTLDMSAGTGTDLNASDDLFAGLATQSVHDGSGFEAGALAADNFVVVPEPSSALLLLGGGAFLTLLAMRRRCQ